MRTCSVHGVVPGGKCPICHGAETVEQEDFVKDYERNDLREENARLKERVTALKAAVEDAAPLIELVPCSCLFVSDNENDKCCRCRWLAANPPEETK